MVKLFVNQVEIQTINITSEAPATNNLTVRVGPIFSLQMFQHPSSDFVVSAGTSNNLKIAGNDIKPRLCTNCLKMADF